MNTLDLYKRAREKWTLNAQLLMMIEEFSEFSVELCHMIRGRPSKNMISEYVDVKIMMEQFTEYMRESNPMFDDLVADEYNFKINRLKTRLDRSD